MKQEYNQMSTQKQVIEGARYFILLIRAKKEGLSFSMIEAIQKMKQQGVWLSDNVIEFALRQDT